MNPLLFAVVAITGFCLFLFIVNLVFYVIGDGLERGRRRAARDDARRAMREHKR